MVKRTAPSGPVVPNVERRQLASYSILEPQDSDKPTIRIPAVFKVFNERSLPVVLKQDEGLFFRDQNSFRFGHNTIDMIFKSIDTLCPSYNYKDVNVILDRSTMRNIFMYKISNLSKYTTHLETVYVTLIGNTLIFKRACESREPRLNSYGNAFEVDFTVNDSPDAAQSAGSYMINEIVIEDMKYLIRSEVDAVHGDLPTKTYENNCKTADTGESIQYTDIDKHINIADREQKNQQMCELKTRRHDLNIDIGSNFIQMFFGNCSHLCVGMRNVNQIIETKILTEKEVEKMIDEYHNSKLTTLPSRDDMYMYMRVVNNFFKHIKSKMVPNKVHRLNGQGIALMKNIPLPITEEYVKKLK